MTNFEKQITSFEKFFKDSTILPAPTASPTLQIQLTAGITQITIGVVSGVEDTQVEKFSNEVANYAISGEVISSLSKNIGKPKTNETEEEFVERASRALREILKKKFNV